MEQIHTLQVLELLELQNWIEIKSTVKVSTVLTEMKALQTTTTTCCQSLQTSKTWTLEQRGNIGFLSAENFSSKTRDLVAI